MPDAVRDYDILIIGGGMVGASLACALAPRSARIGLVEAVPYSAPTQPAYDDRAIALSWGSRRIFEALGLWEEIAPHATPIERIHISDRGHFGITRLDRREEGVEALGHVVIARELGRVLAARLATLANIDIISPAQLTDAKQGNNGIQAQIVDGASTRHTLDTRLLVAADGGDSRVREIFGIDCETHDYTQSAVIANITPGHAHDFIAYERFTPDGPLALLPMSDERCALVWTRPSSDIPRIMALDDAAFLAEVQSQFGQRLGRLQRVGRRQAYPLRLVQACEQVRPRLALIGNAAHTLHPIAGQGFNLGLRDVATLAEAVGDALCAHADPGATAVLRRYAQGRERDQSRVIGFTDGLVRLFRRQEPAVILARNLGLTLLDLCPSLRHALSRQAMGLAGRLPRLGRGLAP